MIRIIDDPTGEMWIEISVMYRLTMNPWEKVTSTFNLTERLDEEGEKIEGVYDLSPIKYDIIDVLQQHDMVPMSSSTPVKVEPMAFADKMLRCQVYHDVKVWLMELNLAEEMFSEEDNKWLQEHLQWEHHPGRELVHEIWDGSDFEVEAFEFWERGHSDIIR